MILDGKKAADIIKHQIKEEVTRLNDEIKLAIVLVGDDPASLIYVASKKKICEEVGIQTVEFILNANASQKEVLSCIEECNHDTSVNAILVQLPLPSHLDQDVIIDTIDPNKDVDGLNAINQGKLFSGGDGIVPATPKGVLTLLKVNYIEMAGKNVVVVGRSKSVGKPLAMLFLKENATVTIAHSKTNNLKDITKRADILAVAVGIPNFITADMVKKEAVVIDIGINRVEGKIVGDVDFTNVDEVASWCTPVPKGVGPMTTASLLENIIVCYKRQKNIY